MSETITPLIQDYIVDFASNNNFFFVKGIQGDGYGVRYARLSLSNNGQPYVIDKDAVRAVLLGTKPDTKEICNECEIVDTSTIQFEITQQMLAVPGKGDYSIAIMSTSTNQMLTSFPFYVFSNQTTFDVSYVTSSNEFTLLISKINQVDALSDDVNVVIANAELVIADCEKKTQLCVEATNTANQAVNDIRALELSIENSEKLREQAESLRQTNTSTAISNANKATKNANDTTKTANQKISELQGKLDEYDSLNVTTSIQNVNSATITAQEKIDEYNSLNLIAVTQNAITATEQANIATNNANTATSNANTASNEAILATQDARKAIAEIQEAVGIDDAKESTNTTWSSSHIHEVIGQDINTAMGQITEVSADSIDALFQTILNE